MKLSTRTKLAAAFGVALLLIAGSETFSWWSTVNLFDSAQLLDHNRESLEDLANIVSQLKDAETGQRGFVITGEPRYLEPYHAGLVGVELAVADVRKLALDHPSQQRRLDALEPLIQRKLDELSQTITLRRDVGFQGALEVIMTDVGKHTMDELRAVIDEMEQEERRFLEQRTVATESTATKAKIAVIFGIGVSTAIFGIIALFLTWTNSRLGYEMLERKRVDRIRETLIAELEDKNAELEQFTYTVSHDLKSPLITVKGFLGALAEDAARGDTERMQADIARISVAADLMTRLLDELLELSRIGRVAGPPEEVLLGELARETVALVAGRVEQGEVQVTVAADLPVVFGDRLRIREVLLNLVDNAVKFMGEESNPHVEIGARQRDGETVCFVSDNGMGVDPRYKEKVFELFGQLDRKAEGTGVGLALVKRIVEVHGGRVWVESEGLGQGSTFYFTLPSKGGYPHDKGARISG